MPNTWKTTVHDIVQVDQSTFDFPKNTTWDSPQKMPNQHEPYSPLPVTLDMVQNPENNDQYSPGGFPGRFCQKPKGEWFSNEGEVNNALIDMLKNREAAIDKMTRDITAGSYSSTYTDEQGEEMYNEQHMNDTDEEPYVNHDQRDYPYGMQDAPQSTNDFPWAKDLTSYVVRLDILENPAFREDPFGIGEYNVVWYTSLPFSDGIEATNPD